MIVDEYEEVLEVSDFALEERPRDVGVDKSTRGRLLVPILLVGMARGVGCEAMPARALVSSLGEGLWGVCCDSRQVVDALVSGVEASMHVCGRFVGGEGAHVGLRL